MFQFPSLPPAPYGFRYGYRRITSGEFPHSEIPGSVTGQRLPRAYRSRPRPSSALSAKASTVCPCSLDQKNTGIDVAMEFSRCTRAPCPPNERSPGANPVSQNSTACACLLSQARRGRRSSRRAEWPDGPEEPSNGLGAHRSNRSGIPRKEVIQPQLPLRLPCYDFTPIIDPTFDGSLPCGLGHRLRVLPTFVVCRAVCTRPGNVFTATLLIRDY